MPHPNAGSSEGENRSPLSTSKSLLGRAREGDSLAWDRLSVLYAPLVFYWCRRRGLRESDAADIVQEVFQAVATHLKPFRKQEVTDTFRGWLRTITENKIRDHFRKAAHEVDAVGGTDAQHRLAQFPAPSDSGSAVSEDDWDSRFFRRVLDMVRQEFEEPTWQAFLRTTVEGRSPKDVGLELSMSPGAVRVAKSRVLRRLREELGDPLP
ncbi:MAG: sigma-70 family polymerase sigma factor [Planctomycetota bacterium]|nr:sigma-70 family polymerase sigma factor [Planctomycetota bacterium]